jgi:phosphoribosylformylglycinamidine cyclo-ligase
MRRTKSLTYKKAGVDIDEGDRFVDLITPLVRKTFRSEVMADIGSFGALFKVDTKKYRKPVLVSGTDGVGTKLKVAFMADRHDTIGIDLVAMCVNDILTSGAEPLFFLDYFATGKLTPEKAAEVVKGITAGCIASGCSLIGGETAEMPGFYEKGEYDLSGFAVGIVDKDKIIDGGRIRAGDALIGIVSNGLHSNGYSLVRKVFFELKKMKIGKYVPELRHSLGEELLRPTTIYVRAFNALRKRVDIKGMAHITGGGIPGNLPRILPRGVAAVVQETAWPEQSVFPLIEKLGGVPHRDMRRTFNMGVGMIMAVEGKKQGRAIDILKKSGYDAYPIGWIEKGVQGVRYAED